MLGKGTTAVEYQKFLRLCKHKVRGDIRGKVVYLYDGAPAHTGRVSTALCAQLFEPLLNVAYSSDFNSIVSKNECSLLPNLC